MKPPPVPVELPAAVERLYAILLAHPGVRIFHTPNQVKLIYPEGWSSAHWEIFSELSQLVYYGAGVLDFIFGHPAKVIDAANLYAFERRV